MDISKIVRYGYHLMLKSSWIAHFFMFMDSSLIFKSKKEGHGYQIFHYQRSKVIPMLSLCYMGTAPQNRHRIMGMDSTHRRTRVH